ncbi:hypothetical protein AMC99_00844 [Altererythrobacter epoxidivorans]|uniref:Recombination protein F n=1 Tax=Altererythrobacter epoxidivorans TaxID=361183 RepID=A0A0M4LUA3_9SPHN|nr:hypothetical protein AMC99_00844 [Altererythrobacter epoxidivorans]
MLSNSNTGSRFFAAVTAFAISAMFFATAIIPASPTLFA